ncbi:Probable phospholipid ABC transporter-binding protein mlaD [Chromobacterium violaceum]|uniref:Probable phospholipid ABC transporter-binding protein mlaD n=1 Tax=Chromobacterium violaceum TaxID=536 RepID=A0A447T5T2_CHRVL|nr:Probable phospholipid ABC transporter-binding protein mlaD [Chromobacterium violaceum]
MSDIRLDPKTYRARVALNIDKQYQLSDDVSASILTSGLLGEQYIGLQQGGSENNLAPGGTITITSSALVLEQLIGKFMTGLPAKTQANSVASGPTLLAAPCAARLVKNGMSQMKKLLTLFCLMLGLSSTQALAAADNPVELIKDGSRQVLDVLKQDNGKNTKQVRQQAEAIAVPLFDFPRMTALAVGLGWRQATPEQRNELTSSSRPCWCAPTPPP